MQPLDDEYWSNRYCTHNDAWDLGRVSPPLQQYIDQLKNKSIRILIPGCGNAYEAQYLFDSGFTNITLIDISTEITSHLQKKWSHTGIQVLHGNFFNHVGQYDLILEQTFFCALHPSLRPAYAAHTSKLLRPQGKLTGVLFDTHFEGGPPFGGSRKEYLPLFSAHFQQVSLAPCYNSIGPRAGREIFLIASS